MKNITRTIRILNVKFPVKSANGYETYNDSVLDMGGAAIRAELKKRCAAQAVKFLGDYDVIGADERVYSMSVETFVRFAESVE